MKSAFFSLHGNAFLFVRVSLFDLQIIINIQMKTKDWMAFFPALLFQKVEIFFIFLKNDKIKIQIAF